MILIMIDDYQHDRRSIYIYIYTYIYIYIKNLENDFSFHETHARSPRGGLTMRRTAEGRSELVELADDSASSTDAMPTTLGKTTPPGCTSPDHAKEQTDAARGSTQGAAEY